ncbi:MAG: hypothetical protein ACI82Q_002400 [Nonlabens sp.]|jgi:hypothetical protein
MNILFTKDTSVRFPGIRIPIPSQSPSACGELQLLGNRPRTRFNSQQNLITDHYQTFDIYTTMEEYSLSYDAVWNIVRPVLEERRGMEMYDLNYANLNKKCQTEKSNVSSVSTTSSQTTNIAADRSFVPIKSTAFDFEELLGSKKVLFAGGVTVALIAVVVLISRD